MGQRLQLGDTTNQLPRHFALHMFRVTPLPGEDCAQLAASLINRMVLTSSTKSTVLMCPHILINDEAFCESTRLNYRKNDPPWVRWRIHTVETGMEPWTKPGDRSEEFG